MYVFALDEVPGNYMKFPQLTWAFWKILAATLTTKRLSHQMCAESPRSPLFSAPTAAPSQRKVCGYNAPSS